MRFMKRSQEKIIILFGILLLLSSAAAAPLYSQQVKKIIGWVKQKGDKDYSPLIEKHYSREGYLLSERDGRYYLSHEYTYDDTGRPVSFDHICGESSGNGTTYYQYEERKILLSETTTRTLYTYDAAQRLTGSIEVDTRSGRICSREIFGYDLNSGLLTMYISYSESYFAYPQGNYAKNSSGYKKSYAYDNRGIITQEYYYRDSQGEDLDYVILYKYDKSGRLWQQTTIHYFDNKRSSTQKDVYKEGKPVRSKEYDAENKIIEIIDFQYFYWDE